MTLSKFLEEKNKRTQLPSEKPIDTGDYNLLLATDKIATPIEAPSVGIVNNNNILNSLNPVANRNFDMVVLKGNTETIPNYSSDAYAFAFLYNGIGDYLDKAINTSNTKLNVPKEYSEIAFYRGGALAQESKEMMAEQTENLKSSAIPLDGRSGGPYTYNGTFLNGNIGTKKKGTALSVKDGDKTLSGTEVMRKVHLRNYWKIAETEKSLSTKSKLIPDGDASIKSDYRDLLNKRLKGYEATYNTDGTEKVGSFLTGKLGLTAEEYKELMLNDSISNNVDKENGSIANAMHTGYGMDAKMDGIIDTGRFTYFGNAASSRWTSMYGGGSSLLMTGNANLEVNFNISTFSADPARTPFFRRQVISLGNEVNYGNAYADINYVSTTNFGIDHINASDNERWSDISKRFKWKFNGSAETRGDSTHTSISYLMHRFPDFMSNLSYIYLIRDSSESSLKPEDSIKIDPIRITEVTVKMPELKNESIAFLNRQISVLSNSISMSHQGSLKVRLDDNLSLYKSILSYMGLDIDYDGKTKTPTLLNNAQVTYHTDKNQTIIPKMDLVVSYALMKGFLPLKTETTASSPYDKDVINYQRAAHSVDSLVYSRYFIFKDVKFIGVPDIDLSKDGDKVEASLDFVFRNIAEADTGLSYPDKDKS